MKTKIAIAVLLVLGLVMGVFYMMGFRLRVGKDKLHTQSKAEGTPLGVVRLLEASTATVLKSTDVRAFNAIYTALGVTADAFARWEKENGYGSLGRNKEGQLFIPGFPIFSKVAWMYIDPVDLSREEVAQLVLECTKAESNTDDAVAKEELNRIGALAKEAASQSATIRFDHP